MAPSSRRDEAEADGQAPERLRWPERKCSGGVKLAAEPRGHLPSTASKAPAVQLRHRRKKAEADVCFTLFVSSGCESRLGKHRSAE